MDLGPAQKPNNHVDLNAPKAYFKFPEYTETAIIGENVTLKCEVGNVSRKCPVEDWFDFSPSVNCRQTFRFFYTASQGDQSEFGRESKQILARAPAKDFFM